jgi:hypothetical protein
VDFIAGNGIRKFVYMHLFAKAIIFFLFTSLAVTAQKKDSLANEREHKKDIKEIDLLVSNALHALKSGDMNKYLSFLPTREELLVYFDSARMGMDDKTDQEMRAYKKNYVDTILLGRKKEGEIAFNDGWSDISKDPAALKTMSVTWGEAYINANFGVKNGSVDYYVRVGKDYYHSIFVLAKCGTRWTIIEYLRFSGSLADNPPLDKFKKGGYHKKLQ